MNLIENHEYESPYFLDYISYMNHLVNFIFASDFKDKLI